MQLLDKFIQMITAIDNSYELYYSELVLFQTSPHIDKFRASYNVVYELYRDVEIDCRSIIKTLKIEEAFNNHGLKEPEFFFKKLLASIKKNQTQWENALANNIDHGDASVSYDIDHIKALKDVIDYRIKRLNMLKDANWKEGSVLPTDNQPKLVYIINQKTKNFKMEYLADGVFDPASGTWQIDNALQEKGVDIIEWTDVPVILSIVITT